MLITKNTDSYNSRKVGTPWIAKIIFSKGPQGDYLWGNWTGEQGCEGILSLNATSGDIIGIDNRGSRNAKYYVVTNDGDLEFIGSKVKAYKFFTENQESPRPLAKYSKKELIDEILKRDSATKRSILAKLKDWELYPSKYK
jgi:hypothetical protein